ncbi:hypothetical protein ACHAW6_000816 [Cyclotella cf. meneghiniana]
MLGHLPSVLQTANLPSIQRRIPSSELLPRKEIRRWICRLA